MDKRELMRDIYPLTIVSDRYGGVYSGAEYTAWHLDFTDVPTEIDSNDMACADFWDNNEIIVGKGKTPNDACADLADKLNIP